MFIEDATLATIVSAITATLVKAADVLYHYIANKKACDTATSELKDLREKLTDLHELLNKVDESGTPLIYYSFRLATRQKEHGDLLNTQHDILKNQTYNTEMIIKMLDKLCQATESMARILDRVSNSSDKRG